METIDVEGAILKYVDKFCSLGDMIRAEVGAEVSSIMRVRCGWNKFR